MNIVMNSSSSAMFGRMRLIATQPLEALDAEGLGLEDLGHAADVDALEEVVLSERDGLLQRGHITGDFSCLQLRLAVFSGVGGRGRCLSRLSPMSMYASVAPTAANGEATKTANGIR